MAHVAWTLTDNSTGTPDVFSFPINPNEFIPPGRKANIATELGTAPNSPVVVFQGRDQLSQGQMSGAVNSETFYDDLQTWTDKWYVLTLTDDQARSWDILITGMSWKRLRRANNQWRFDYTIDFIEVA